MKNESMRSLKKLTKSTVSLYHEIALIIIICLAFGAAGYSYLKSTATLGKEVKSVSTFDPFRNGSEASKSDDSSSKYRKLTALLLSEPFAFSGDKTISYCIAVDKDYYAYIVALKSDSMDEYQELIDYTYSDSTAFPPYRKLLGFPEEMSGELKGFAIEGINIFYNDTIATPANIDEIVGSLYLNTSKEPSLNYMGYIAFAVLGGVAAVFLGIEIFSQKEKKKRLRDLSATYSEQDLMNIDDELNHLSTLCLNNGNLFITPNYLISKKPELDIISKKEITQVYGYNSVDDVPARQGVVAITLGGVSHNIALIPAENKFNSITDTIVENLKSKFPDIQYGVGSSFYETGTINGENPVTGKKSNMLLGIVGAIIGAALGSILWVILGLLGYMSGFAGFLMIIMAIGGYSLLSGKLDLKGRIISVVITLAMLLFANYTTYVITFWKAANTSSISDLLATYRNLPAMLTASDGWRYFYKDLIIGMGISLFAIFIFLNTKRTPPRRR